MIQHNILMYLARYLYCWGYQEQLLMIILKIDRIWKQLLKFSFIPLSPDFCLHLVFSFWHVGAFYEAAISDKTLHMAEHLSMFFTSVAMWWPICGPSKRIPPPSMALKCCIFLQSCLDKLLSLLCLPFLKRYFMILISMRNE